MSLKGYVLVVLSGFLWGISTPGLRHESRHLAWNHREEASFVSNLIRVLNSLVINWKFVAYLLVNQLGSILYTLSLSCSAINVAVPVSNSINLALIVLIGCYKEKVTLRLETCLGIVFVLVGTVLCIACPRSAHEGDRLELEQKGGQQ